MLGVQGRRGQGTREPLTCSQEKKERGSLFKKHHLWSPLQEAKMDTAKSSKVWRCYTHACHSLRGFEAHWLRVVQKS